MCALATASRLTETENFQNCSLCASVQMPVIKSVAAKRASIAPGKDRKTFRRLSHNAPQASAHMLTAEMVSVVRIILI